jgi:hypothetical protein
MQTNFLTFYVSNVTAHLLSKIADMIGTAMGGSWPSDYDDVIELQIPLTVSVLKTTTK